ncbi:histidinol phosphatase [Kribbella antibiotica]|uniref:Histidinol phosphatase n=1 Tax=Kribbella antibiotica TaxID=190195 RepID=A0A4R4ZL23_9ACTN|nr:inositol monophosphatase family protein [Kribbella antibiotica]TDD59478.1 histidinol phosphatase [Kribbella antibiotica]
MNDLELAFSTSDEAAEVALAHFKAGVAVSWKADGSPVTEADREVEHLLRDRLSAARPGDAFFGEELGELGESERIWIIDPIDGTRRFASGDPNWRVQFALEVNGVTELSVVTSPALGRRWWATRGGGAFETSWPHADAEPRRLQVSTTAEPATAVVDAVRNDQERLAIARPAASPLPVIELVRGEIDGFLVERYSKWDHAPWILLVEEAGGRFTNPVGTNTGDHGGGIYSNANLHTDLTTALNYPSRKQ